MGRYKRATRNDSIMPMSQKFFKSAKCGAKGRTFGVETMHRATKTYASEVRKTIEAADVVIEVLDARDPLGSRSREIEEAVVQKGKRLVLLLNKIDLVPKENVRQWIHYLRQKLPTIAFQASTQEQQNRLGRMKKSNLSCDTSKCIGADLIMKLLKNYCRNKDIKTTIRVGVVGYPNVGKSSVINSLKRKRTCKSGATAGLTKQAQEIELDGNIRLIDSPGVVLASGDQFDAVEMALKNAMRVEQLDDPLTPVMAILRRCSVETVLNDWNSGKLRYHTQVPTSENATHEVISSELLNQMSAEFNLDALGEEVRVLIDELGEHEMVVDDESMEENDEDTKTAVLSENVVVGPKLKRKEPKAEMNPQNLQAMLEACRKSDGGIQMNKMIKTFSKRNKKRQRKTERKLDKLTDMFSGLGGDAVKMETEDDWFGCMLTTTD
ncbi:hypothetical protein M3Y98_01025800 [Aphelenchoides besseyi]|nr:hypothetical protein M3Y98_01025800 [Aphelenchoides besseyi]